MPADQVLSFGPFRLMPGQRLLIEGERPLRLGSRAFDILVTLVERAGEVVSQAELMARVWPHAVVDPGALRVHLFGLRKALGDGRGQQRYIVNVPQQGYCFVAPVERTSAPAQPAPVEDQPARPGPVAFAAGAIASLPVLLTRVVGRDELVGGLVRELPSRRCVTLVGAGGIGKTTLALAVAHGLTGPFEQQVLFVGLAPIEDPKLVANALASAIGITALASDPVRGVCAYLRDKRMLLVIDNCEHLIDPVSELVEQILVSAPQVHVLATSREPLRIQGEWVQRIGALDVPPPVVELDASAMQRYPALELFIERVRSCHDAFDPAGADLATIAEICRALDGIPLAIELAAAGVERLGVRGVAAHLGDRLSLLTRGRRTALPRHQTLRAALDWSYGLLTPTEQAMLRSLSVFRGRFTLESALAVCSDPAAQGATAEDLFNLMAKSLLSSDIGGETVHYWLLETTRQYASQLLAASGEEARLARRHAAHMLELSVECDAQRQRVPTDVWRAGNAYRLEDVRAALLWSFGPTGDAAIGIALAAASAPLWFALSRVAEFLPVAEQALAAMVREGIADPAREMVLCEAYGHSLWNTRGAGEEQFERAFEIAQSLGSDANCMRALWGLWLAANSRGDYHPSARLAERFGDFSAKGPDAARILHHRMMAVSLHHCGRHAQARDHSRQVLAAPVTLAAAAFNSAGFQFDQLVAAHTSLARTHWLLGQPDQAVGHVREAVARAHGIGHVISLAFALGFGCTPVMFWVGDWDEAERFTQMLERRTEEYSLLYWQVFAAGYRLLHERHDGRSTGTLDALGNPAIFGQLRETLCSIDAGLADESVLLRGETETAAWCTPELWRIRAEQRLAQGSRAPAKKLLQQAIELAQQQQALAWELRCATSLARLHRDAGQRAQGRAVLEPVLARFDEGAGTADVRAAAELLRELG
ncbi:ATP-binding protein [Caldimonas sp. KR1-144]|uniref:ATP-binding protein n=1 Tax=Caldimonas sp. KR1-144 TaxID=3400911 RepID=UPI003C04495E